MHNNYHGFCKGAWQTRRQLEEGVSIRVIPLMSVRGGKEVLGMVPHWQCKQCKQCEFKSKGLNDSNVLPGQVCALHSTSHRVTFDRSRCDD